MRTLLSGAVFPVCETIVEINSSQPGDDLQYRPAARNRLLQAAMAWLARMSRSSYVMRSGYRSRVASRSHRCAGVEYAASSRSSSERRLRSAFELGGVSKAMSRNQAPG